MRMSPHIVMPLNKPEPTPRTPLNQPASSPPMNRLAIAVMPTYHSRLTRTVCTSELNARANESVVSRARSASPSTTPAKTGPQRILWGFGEPAVGIVPVSMVVCFDRACGTSFRMALDG
jgi:hypothetical protein